MQNRAYGGFWVNYLFLYLLLSCWISPHFSSSPSFFVHCIWCSLPGQAPPGPRLLLLLQRMSGPQALAVALILFWHLTPVSNTNFVPPLCISHGITTPTCFLFLPAATSFSSDRPSWWASLSSRLSRSETWGEPKSLPHMPSGAVRQPRVLIESAFKQLFSEAIASPLDQATYFFQFMSLNF